MKGNISKLQMQNDVGFMQMQLNLINSFDSRGSGKKGGTRKRYKSSGSSNLSSFSNESNITSNEHQLIIKTL